MGSGQGFTEYRQTWHLVFCSTICIFMNKKIKYTDEPLGELKVISDLLPSPEELAFRDDTVKVTISLSRSSIDFFKREAKKHKTQHQKMIRRLLVSYTAAHEQSLTKRPRQRAKTRA